MKRNLTLREMLAEATVLNNDIKALLTNYTISNIDIYELTKIQKKLIRDINIIKNAMSRVNGKIGREANYKEIKEKLFISNPQIVEKRAINKLRHINFSRKFRDYLKL